MLFWAPFAEPNTLSPALPRSAGGGCFAFFGPLGQAEPRVQTRSGPVRGAVLVVGFFGPLTQAEARSEGEGQARSGGARTPAFAPGTGTRALGEPSEPTDERGDPAPVFQVRGAESGVPFLSVPFFGHAKKGTRRTGVGEPGKDEGPGDARPGERACHGRQAQDLQARARRAERGKPGSK